MLLTVPAAAGLSDLEQIDLKSYEAMREVERYQMKVAEKHYLKGSFEIALAEYEKFLTLYEKSPGAPYAQLMWSHSLMKLKKPQTALRDGFQSVIDYWPESHEATLAAYCMADAYKRMGKVKEATASFRLILDDYPDHAIATRARLDLLAYAKLHQNDEEVLRILREFTFELKRTEKNAQACLDASRELASMHFYSQEFEQGRKALATSYEDGELDKQVREMTVATIGHLWKEEKTRSDARKLADQIIASLRQSPELTSGVLYRIGSLHAMVGRPDQVWKIYDEIAKAHGTDDALRGNRASWLLARDKRDEARRWYERFENVVEGKRHLVGMAMEEGNIPLALEIYRQLLELDGERASEYQWAIAGCYEKQGEWKKAIAIYRMIDDFPKNHFAMAACHRKLKEYDEAILLYQQTKVIDGVAPRASIEIAFTHEEAGEKEKAIRTFQLTCKRYPKAAEAARAHAHLQEKYNIHVTLGGAEEK
ncbi:tetratricopeptide repeat protein [Haloferula sp. A504]|uniref:tetratricopeptide repeat protein n=1 Tax=Haloferula sp. A504 TaxID=3373601 RepID=UPI0031C3BD4E|nr:tetratricopeptide repeat protein [Verrucomicrobiaceae bacterium E54]